MERGPLLVCLEGSLAGQRLEITLAGLRIGRDPGNEMRLDEAGISRQHARVLLHNGAIWVQDAGSRNGIFVNGERVPDHRQVKVGDRLTVGSSVFQVVAAADAPPPPARRPAAARAGWKIWPFALAAVFALFIVVCISCFGRGPASSATTPEVPAYSLSTVLDQPPTPEAPPAPQSVEQALAVAAGADAAATQAKLPDPPAGVSAAELLNRAQGMYDAGRLNDARVHYQMALKVDPACEICPVRIERLNADIGQRAQLQFDAGMRYYDSMQLSQAISAWETVIMLVPDTTDPMHVRAKEYLEKARSGAAGGP